MISNKTILALIPARGGSKGLPSKNTKVICGKPLIVWSIDKAKRSKYLDMILVTTDDNEIAKISRAAGAYVPFLRPAELATDSSSTYDAIRHAINYLSESEGQKFDYIILLEPTSPLREDDDIDRMLEHMILHSDNFDSIVSVGEIDEHPSIVRANQSLQFHPYRALPGDQLF